MKVTLVRSRAIDSAVYKLAESLSNNGYKVELLVWDRQGTLENKDEKEYGIRKLNLKAPYNKLTALFYLPIWWVYEFLFLLKNDADIIHACDLDTLYPAIFVKLLRKRKLCYTIYDFYANNLPDGKFIKLRTIIRKIIANIEKRGIGLTDILFLVDISRYEEIAGSKIKGLEYIYNSPPDYFSSQKLFQKKREKKNDILTIFYAGTIRKLRGLQHIISAVSELEGVKLIIAGHPTDKSLIEFASKFPEKIQYVGWLPSYKDVIKNTLEADVLFRFSDPKIPKTKYESPNKLFEAMMCGKPIIVSDGSSMANIVREEKCGLIVPYGDINAIKEAIRKLRDDPALRVKLGKNGRKAYEKKYSWDIMEKRLLDVYKDVSNKRTSDKKEVF